VCAMRGGCGRKSPFDPELPCVDDGDANEVSPSPAFSILSTIALPGGYERENVTLLGSWDPSATRRDASFGRCSLAGPSRPTRRLTVLSVCLAPTQTTQEQRDLLSSVCGPSWEIPSSLCCTSDQIAALRDNLLSAEPCVPSLDALPVSTT
jgi:hypothetical protein